MEYTVVFNMHNGQQTTYSGYKTVAEVRARVRERASLDHGRHDMSHTLHSVIAVDSDGFVWHFTPDGELIGTI